MNVGKREQWQGPVGHLQAWHGCKGVPEQKRGGKKNALGNTKTYQTT